MTCRACHFEHPVMMTCGVAKRIRDVAINNPSAINTGAINGANGETPLDQPLIPVVAAKAIGVDSPERRTPNRRSRTDYNGYMREYMRKRRAQNKPA